MVSVNTNIADYKAVELDASPPTPPPILDRIAAAEATASQASQQAIQAEASVGALGARVGNVEGQTASLSGSIQTINNNFPGKIYTSGGNNGSVSCNNFCADRNPNGSFEPSWMPSAGICVGESDVDGVWPCDHVNGLGKQTSCKCYAP